VCSAVSLLRISRDFMMLLLALVLKLTSADACVSQQGHLLAISGQMSCDRPCHCGTAFAGNCRL
jgi:hypothetical protein